MEKVIAGWSIAKHNVKSFCQSWQTASLEAGFGKHFPVCPAAVAAAGVAAAAEAAAAVVAAEAANWQYKQFRLSPSVSSSELVLNILTEL